MKVRIGALAKEWEMDVDELVALAHSKLSKSMISGKGGKGLWINEGGQEILEKAIYVPEVVPKHYDGIVVRLAPNPRYVYAYIDEIKKSVPVCVPKVARKRMYSKKINIESIEDNAGTSFRYVK